jgi:hypothetical protein
MAIHIQESYGATNRHDQKRSLPCHIIVKTVKSIRQTILKSARKKCQITFKDSPMRLKSDFLTDTLQPRRSWKDVFQFLKENNCLPRLLYSVRLTFRNEKVKTFQDNRELITT